MSHFESQKVHTFYKNNHTHFSNTRYIIWPYIRTFLSTTYNPTHLILDNGCGNGRCIMYNNIIGMDYSRELLQHITKGNSSRDSSVYGSGSMYGSGSRDISRDISNKDNNYISNTNISNTKDNSTSNPSTINPSTYNPSTYNPSTYKTNNTTTNKTNNNIPSPLDLLRGDCLYIPFKNNTYNIIISIAVLHHISTLERRIIFLKEIYRILKYKGICLIGVWSIKHRNNKRFIECSGVGGSVGEGGGEECGMDKGYVNTSNTSNTIRDTTDNIIRDIKDIKDIKDNNNISNIKDIPFSYGDVYATWNNVSVRYVHLFNIKELCDMCVSVGFTIEENKEVGGVTIEENKEVGGVTIEEVIEEHETLYVRVRKREHLIKAVFGFETALIKKIIQTKHAVAHIGVNKMMALIVQKYYGIPKAYIREYVKDCEICSQFNSLKTIQPVYINHITKKYDLFMMDCILNVIDTYTKHLYCFKLINKTSELVRDSLKFLFNNFGVPVAIQFDNGRKFKNALLEVFLTDLNIKIIHGRPRNPKAQGQIERVNRTIKRSLAKKLHDTGGRTGIEDLNNFIYAYNRSVYSAKNKSLFMHFFEQPGFNNPLSRSIIVENEASTIVPAIDIDPDIVLVEENAADTQWILEIASDVHEEFTETVTTTTTIKADDREIDSNIRSNGAKHFKNYRERIIESNNSNGLKKDLSIGNHVLIKKTLRYEY
ncbi:putative methyltransferase [Hamiltosporidium tvaerminnensis]|uniref:Putative methyltransferase n=1 Tax=Hamiltosporidium tvaerminnensis TaxID=1176355 RepID=A0A4Q9M5X5_9MICR|nr:putative methyltransferase [Hamiltosporidium tvaerminnensis]